MKLKKG